MNLAAVGPVAKDESQSHLIEKVDEARSRIDVGLAKTQKNTFCPLDISQPLKQRGRKTVRDTKKTPP